MMLGSLNKSQVSSKHGPGTSGGNGVSSGGLGPISKKKYSLGGSGHGGNNSEFNDGEGIGFQNLNTVTNPNESFNGASINQIGGSQNTQMAPVNLKYQLMKNQTLNPAGKLSSHNNRNSKLQNQLISA